ncbi:MAG TPA: response regulator, partial [Gemmatimonadaceae bacterium]|nr:response regulator [Gemmatimonadaceae bacterium]
LLENLSDAIVACDADGILTYFNSATQRIHGLPAEPLPAEEWADHYALYDADGKTPLPREQIPLFRALKGEAVRNAELVIAPTGQPPHSLLASGTAIHDGNGAKIGAVVVMRDITELTVAQKELEHSSAQLRQAQKMEAVGRLAGGVAHDFNNLLTAITSYAQFVLDDTAPDDPRRDDIGEIRAASDRAAALTRQLLAFSRQQVLHIQTMDPNASIVGSERLLARIIGDNVRITTRLDPAAWAISCDPGQFEQVIFNLAINGRDAMPAGGVLVIETTNVELDAAAASQYAGVVPGRYLKLNVGDSGVGMDAETQSRIFEPFYTTKGVGKGTGLGLSTVYGIVTQCGGSVTVQSEPGVGTTFCILLPAASPDSIVVPAAERIAVQGRGTETILLVEDDLTIRRVVERILKRNGYTILLAEDGAVALEIVRDRGKEIDMLITDMMMPGMSGREVVESIRSLNPEIGALIISGYTAEANGSLGASLAGIAFLDKPFTAQQLTTRIREVLDKPRGLEKRDFLQR